MMMNREEGKKNWRQPGGGRPTVIVRSLVALVVIVVHDEYSVVLRRLERAHTLHGHTR